MYLSRSVLMSCVVGATMAFSGAGHAASFSFSGPDSAGDTVNVSATVTASTNTLTVVVNNLIVDQKTVAQNISDFTVSVGGTPITSSGSAFFTPTATYVNVAANGTPSAGSAPASAGWLTTYTSGTVHVTDIAGGQCGPACTILGAPGAGGNYNNANNSIAGNDPHNPFINQSATFVITALGITASTQITGFQWSFGTAPGVVAGNTPVPLPPAAVLFGTALVGLGVLGRRRKKGLMPA